MSCLLKRLLSEASPLLFNSLFSYRGSNVCVICEEHQLLALGTEEGLVECFDPRSHTSVGVLDINPHDEG